MARRQHHAPVRGRKPPLRRDRRALFFGVSHRSALTIPVRFTALQKQHALDGYRAGGIGCAAGNDPAGLPNTVNSMIPSGVARGQLISVNRTKRHFVGGISSKIVLRTMAFMLWSSTVV